MFRVSVMLLSMVAATGASFGAERPNVVFIVADDLGWNDVGVYSDYASPGADTSTVIRTPTIDWLAHNGMMFTDAHTPMALCAPNRFSLLTGSNPYRNGRPGGSWGLSASSGFSAGTDRTGEAGRHLTSGDIMRRAGYSTGYVGKTHLGGTAFDLEGNELWKARGKAHSKKLFRNMDFSRRIEDSMVEHGFDYAFTMEDGIQGPPYAYFRNGTFTPIDPRKKPDNTSIRQWKRQKGHRIGNNGESEFAHGPFVGDVDYDSSQVGITLAQEACEFIDRHSGKDQPFFLYYNSQAVHWPHTPPLDFDGDAQSIDLPVKGETPGPTSDMIYEIDLQVKAIVDKLRDDGVLNETLIVLTSDNGGLKPSVADFGSAEHSTVGVLRGHKATFYEGGHRVPFIAMWGDGTAAGSRILPGTVNHQLIAAHDWIATLYDLTDQRMDAGQAMDSTTLLPALLGEHPIDEPVREFLSFGFPGIRVGDYFLLCERKQPNRPKELYNLAEDIEQQNNLIDAPDQQSRIASMLATMKRHNNCNARDLSEERSTVLFNAAVR